MNLLKQLKNWLLKRVSDQDSAILDSKSIYILPTREGLIYAILVLVILAAAINFNNSLVFFFAFLLVGVGLVSMRATQQNLLNLQFTFAHIKPVFCPHPISLPLLIEPLSKHPLLSPKISHYSIDVQFSHSTDELDLANRVDIYCNDKSTLALFYATHQRGRLTLPSITISSLYPLGLFRAWANIQLNSDALVYPSPARSFTHQPQSGSDSEGQGEQGRGFDDFSGFKNYQVGEPLNHIHWKAYAREQGLLSKTFSGANDHEYWLNWHELQGDIEHRISQLCRLILDAELQGDRYGLILPNIQINISQGDSHQHHCLKALALYQVAS
ncbi:MAG: DUF58 domain-containing protein [Gammaproteobacteria bacterium]|nr:DUF58 domain-containing protein [Gammaproteobacteria bacterium]